MCPSCVQIVSLTTQEVMERRGRRDMRRCSGEDNKDPIIQPAITKYLNFVFCLFGLTAYDAAPRQLDLLILLVLVY